MRAAQIALTFLCLSLISPSPALTQEEGVGLVLAGGGARGIAHVGAITALEEMQVPVSAIAGTSMGALVGGLYAIGLNSEELREVVENMAWDEAFEDSLERDSLPQRRKSDDYDYPSSVSLAVNNGTLSIPLGFVQGQQVRQIIKQLTIDADHINDFSALPTPFRAVATDIETGNAYIFSEGDIVTAMRASMSLPGLLAPVEHDGRLLVDGGLAMNIPVSVGRSMGTERLIVIDIGTPLRERENINNLLDVADQMLNFLTRKNSLEQLEQLTEKDILINPDLQGIGMLDFEDTQEIYRRGYEATMALAEELQVLALNDGDWATYLASRELVSPENPVIDHIAIFDNSALRDDIIRVRLSQQVGKPLDREQLSTDMAEIYALDQWEIIDYDVVEEERGTVLQIRASAKTWGGDDLKFGLNFVTDLDGGSDINLGVSYLWKGLTDLGGELYARTQLGDTIMFSAEFYQPLDLRSKFFVVPYVGYRDYDVTTLGPEYDVTDPTGIWRVRRLSTQFDTGWNAFKNTQLRLGVFRNKGEYRSDAEFGGALPEARFDEGGAMFSARYDTLDNAFFPTSGAFFYGEYQLLRSAMGADEDYERWQAIAQGAFSFGDDDRNTVIVTGRTGQSVNASNAPQNYFQLGGLFNLSGVSQNYLSARQMAFAMVQYQHRLSDTSVLPFDMPAYVGASLEGGELWSDRSDVNSGDFINAGSVYLAVDSPIGAIYLAYGRTEDSQDALYLALGWPFLNNQLRIGR
ncbi:MAG: BamA/TamA family outer membrane protein [Halieaceae bacterium]|jgi:NTE family protein|nr:BamA/TamA family outer membrane protein [Halieaceae bacterium]MBT6125313.1 BamA/TamA family outer membrane protein [Halieaceae bacterium]